MSRTRNNRKSNRKSNRKQQQNRKSNRKQQQNGGGYYNDLEAAPIGLRPVVASYDDNNPPAPKLTGGRRKFKGGNNKTEPNLEHKMDVIKNYIQNEPKKGNNTSNKTSFNVITKLFNKSVGEKVDELYNLVVKEKEKEKEKEKQAQEAATVAQAPAEAQEAATVAQAPAEAQEAATVAQEPAPEAAKVAAKGGSKNKQRRQRKQQGGHNENAQFGCRQPEWTPDCR
jgi:hypothetical protein